MPKKGTTRRSVSISGDLYNVLQEYVTRAKENDPNIGISTIVEQTLRERFQLPKLGQAPRRVPEKAEVPQPITPPQAEPVSKTEVKPPKVEAPAIVPSGRSVPPPSKHPSHPADTKRAPSMQREVPRGMPEQRPKRVEVPEVEPLFP